MISPARTNEEANKLILFLDESPTLHLASGGMVAWDYMNGGRRFNCAQQKKKYENDKKIPVIDMSHFLQEAKQSYNDLKSYNDERERQIQVEAERQRRQREQEERDRQERMKQQKMEQERVENQKKQEAHRLRLEEEKRLQMVQEQLKHAEEQKKQQLLVLEQERERESLKQLYTLERIKLTEEVERLRKLVDQQQTSSVDKVQIGWKPTIPSQPGAELCSAKTPDDRLDDDAWRDYIFDWKYDHCIITSYV
ncbi:cancer-related regulator of actin dynamics homolog isoform X2 [Nasonia vitripennis]|uniref:Uncharacterized protein n=1 Tax=Nasonia vitripennis TaxID=7425 RepID=A0A7M7QA52_NASVI|nr:cancer-related regulator of actin dynamics homolog isoform X2 [Nasonia vitripennis]